jgi:F-type H+-transporting ATPase subunit delta
MNNPRLAARYAKSLLDLAVEKGELATVIQDMKYLDAISKSNPDFVAILKSPVITSDKKEKIIESVTKNNISAISSLFIRLLIRKTRETNLPEIAVAFIKQYNTLKGIRQVKITTAVPISEQLQKDIADRVATDPRIESIELEAKVDESLIGGFTLQMDDILVDASISRDLSDVKKQFMSNEYLHRLR